MSARHSPPATAAPVLAVAVVLVVVLLFSRAAAADEANASTSPRFVPTAGLAYAISAEKLALDVGGPRFEERRSEGRFAVLLGLSHPLGVAPSPARTALTGHATVGLGVTLHGGHYPLLLREDVGVSHRLGRALRVHAGLEPGLVLDLTRTSRSYVDLGLALGLTVADLVEVVYRPYLSVPVGSETSSVLGGTRTLSAGGGIVPLELTVRLRVRALGF